MPNFWSTFSFGAVTRVEPQAVLVAEQFDEISRGDADVSQSIIGKLRSVVWEHFTITERENGKPVKAVCRHCSNEFKCDTKKNGTSSMKNHLENEHSVTCTKKPPGAHPPNPLRYLKEKLGTESRVFFLISGVHLKKVANQHPHPFLTAAPVSLL